MALNARTAFLRSFYVLSSNRALQKSSVSGIVEKISIVAVATYARTELQNLNIYSETYEEHVEHVRQVLRKLADAGLHFNPKKCEFHQTETTYRAW